MTLPFNSTFAPAWWCRGPHIQTLWPYWFRLRPRPRYQRERLELPDGDFIDLDRLGDAAASPVVVILHGLGGSSQSHYIRGITTRLRESGYRSVVAQHRGCGGEPNRLPVSYHAGVTRDLDCVIRRLREREPRVRLFALGYSLGGNMLLKWLHDNQNSAMISAAAVVSAPLELAHGAARMERGLSRMYQWRLIAQLKQSLYQKFSRRACPIDLGRLRQVYTFRQFDDVVTAPLHGFRNADDYYERCSARQFLRDIRTPTLVIHAADDPLLTKSAIPSAGEVSPAVKFELSRRGGHCGFVSGYLPGMADYWSERRICEYFDTIRNAPSAIKPDTRT